MIAEEYARLVVGDKVSAPKYVKIQCHDFLEILEGKNDRYILDLKKLKMIEKILQTLRMPRGLKAGQRISECSCGYQWLFYTAILCVVYKDNTKRRRYETAILEIGRKNFKTFTIATIFILLFLLEPKFSKFYSVAPDGALSREVKTAIEEILKSSPSIYLQNGNYNTTQIRQHSDTLHPPTKLLSEKITNCEFEYEKNSLLEINFENAKCTYDTNLNRYITKKKSRGKVDMVMALIDAVHLLQQDIIFDDSSWAVQVI